MIRIKRWGRKALLIEWKQQVSPEIRQEVYALNELLLAEFAGKLWQSIPAYCSLTLQFKVYIDDIAFIRERILASYSIVQQMDAVSQDTDIIRIGVCYDKQFALDWSFLEQELEVSFADIVRMHQSVVYDVYMLGFLPGFAFLGILPESLQLPRRSSPRKRVPKGSVAIAERQTAIYPSNSPGGWHIIGNSQVPLVSNNERKPVLLQAGDRVQFYSINRSQDKTYGYA